MKKKYIYRDPFLPIHTPSKKCLIDKKTHRKRNIYLQRHIQKMKSIERKKRKKYIYNLLKPKFTDKGTHSFPDVNGNETQSHCLCRVGLESLP